MRITLSICIMLALLFAAGSAAIALNPPICPHIIGWNSQIASWAQNAPWIKVIYSSDVAPAKATGAKVFYRPWDADSANHDDGCLPASQTGSQYADMVWAKISAMPQRPEAVGYRNEFNWDVPANSKRTCAEFVNYKNRLRALGYTGKIIFGSFGVGWVDGSIWNDPDLTAAATAADGIETHEYFDLTVSCVSPWLCFRHRDIAINPHPYLQGKEWYIGEFGSDRCCSSTVPSGCGDALCRRGWRDNNKLTETAYINQMKAYRAGCANQVVAVFVFQQGDSGAWGDFDVMGTSVADYMKSTWSIPQGTLSGYVRDNKNAAISGAAITLTPGNYSTASSTSGAYTISAPAGTYTVTVAKSGYGQVVQAGIAIAGSTTTSLSFNLLPLTSISSAKGLADNTPNVCADGIVTALFPINSTPTRIYIEDSKRNCGLGVATGSTFSLGDEVQAQGTMTTDYGERILSASKVTKIQSGQPIPKPIGMNAVAVGGGQFQLQQGVINKAMSNEPASGLNNIGMLVSAWGKVTYVDSSNPFFYLDDGSGLSDGSGWSGVRVDSTSLPTPANGAQISLTGISGATTLNNKIVRVLRPRSVNDLSYAAQANLIQNPSFEIGNMQNWTIYGSIDGMQSGTWFGNVASHSGRFFVGSAANGGIKSGGVYQRVQATAGFHYQARTWSRVYHEGNTQDSVQNRVGIDPTGRTDPNSPNVLWSTIDTQALEGSSLWRELTSPAATCSGGFITIFLDGKQFNTQGWHINCFDDAGIYVAQ